MEDKNQPVTKEYLDKTMSEYSKNIIEAVNFGFEENKKDHQRLEEKIDES